MPRVNLYLLVPLLILLCWSLFMTFNAKYDVRMGEWVLHVNHDRFWEAAPGSFAYRTSLGYSYELLALICFVFMIGRSIEGQSWKWIIGCFAILGACVALVGMGHRIMGIDSVWAVESLNKPKTFFAPFVYGANAGSFMNLTMLIAVALAIAAWRKRKPNWASFWAICAGLCVLGVIFTASKAGIILFLAQMIIFILWTRKQLVTLLKEVWEVMSAMSLEKKATVGAVLFIFVFFAISGANFLITRVDTFLGAIEKDGRSYTIEGRLELMEMMWKLVTIPDEASWHGFGPGSFGQLMIFYLEKDSVVGRSDFGHCDPLQTLVEWGYLGTACWFFIGGGAVVRGIFLLWKGDHAVSDQIMIKALCVALVMVGLHSCFDFPLSIFSIHLVAMGFCAMLWCFPKSSRSNFRDADEGLTGGR